MIAALVLALQRSDLDAVLDHPHLSGAIVCATVVDESGGIVYERSSRTRVMPGSSHKLFTAAFALSVLGPAYRPETRFWKRPGKLLISSDGDPSLTTARARQISKQLGGGQTRVWLRQAYRPYYAPTWELDNLPNRYAAPITAFTIDRGGFELWAENGRVVPLPPGFDITLTVVKGAGPPKVRFDPILKTLLVTGSLPQARTRLDTLAIPRPDLAAASLFGRWGGTLGEEPSGKPDLVVKGEPLSKLLEPLLTDSNNMIAESALLMAAARRQPLGIDPYKTATAEMAAFLKAKVGLDPTNLSLADGSGMSRHNLVTTDATVRLIRWCVTQPWAAVWSNSLARPGAGTLARRLAGVPVRAKTGTLEYVTALSGIVDSAASGRLYFSVIINHHKCSTDEARAVQDEFVRKLAGQGASGTSLAHAVNHESLGPHPRARPPVGHWIRGPRGDRYPALARIDRGAEPADARVHSAERVAVRSR